MKIILRLGFAAVLAMGVAPLFGQIDHAKSTAGAKITLPAFPADHAGNIISTAHAEVQAVVVDKGPITEKKVLNGAGGSGLADTGNVNGTQAKAEAKWTIAEVQNKKGFYKVFTEGTFAEVTKGRDSPPGLGRFNLNDPIEFIDMAGLTLPLQFGFENFSLTAEGNNAFASFSESAGSSIAGLEKLFSLNIGLKGSNPTQPQVDLWLNPLLALDPTVVKNTILAGLAYNAMNATYSGTFDFLAIDLRVPTTQNTVSISWNVEGLAVAVPEASTLGYWGAAFLLGLIGVRYQRSRKPIL